MSQGLKEKLFRGGVWALGGKIVSIVCAFLLNVALTRALSPAEYGAYFIAFNTVIILATFGTFGVDQVAVRFTAIRSAMSDTEGVRKVIVRCLGIVFIGAAVVCVGFYFVAPWFFTRIVKAPTIVTFSALMILWVFLATFQRQLAETFRGLKDIRGATLYGGIRNNGMLISIASSLMAMIFYATNRLDFESALLIMSLSSLMIVVLSSRKLWQQTHIRSDASQEATKETLGEPNNIRVILSEGWPLWLSAILSVINTQGDSWLAASFDTSDNVALYGAAQRFVTLVMAPLAIVNALLPPFIAELHVRGEIKRMERVVRAVAGIAGLPAIVLLLILIFAGKGLLGATFGSYYEASYPLLVILGVGQLVNVLTGSCFIVLVMSGHKDFVLRITLISSFTLIVLGIIGGYWAGITGVAIASTVSISLHNCLGMYCVQRKLRIWTFIGVSTSLLAELFSMVRRKNQASISGPTW